MSEREAAELWCVEAPVPSAPGRYCNLATGYGARDPGAAVADHNPGRQVMAPTSDGMTR